ncbi:MAG: P-type conjugative transfer protein TrbJ [Syntrophobacteraceae bacterium]
MERVMSHGRKVIRILGRSLLVVALIVRSNPSICSSYPYASEMTQLLNNLELLHHTLQQAQELSNQLKMLQDMAQNLKNIPDQVWTPASQHLQSLMNVVKQGESLAFSSSNISEEFQHKFKGFVQAGNFQTEYKNWSSTVRDSLRTSLAVANLQSQQFTSEEAVLSALRSMSQSAEGRMQAIQVGTQISVEQVAQLQKLRGLMMAQIQAQNAFMAGEQQQKDNVKAAEENFFNPKFHEWKCVIY